MPPETVIRILQTLNRRGAYQVALTGGEPALYPHKDLIKIIKAVSDSTLIMINTNAYNFSEELARELAEAGVLVKVSLYGHDEESYRKFTGVKDAYQRVKKSLDLLRKYDAELLIDVIYTRTHEKLGIKVEDMVEFARQYTSYMKVVSLIIPGWGGREHVQKLSTQSLPKSFGDHVAEEVKESGRISINVYIRPFMLPEYNCALSKAVDVFTTVDGITLACPFFDEICSHVNNPNWMAMHFLKIVAHRSNPWPGGRCGILRYAESFKT